MVFIGLISTSLQPLSPTSWLPSTPQPFPCRVRAKRVVVAVPKKSLVTIILVRSPSNFIFTQFGCLLTAPKRKKLKIPNFIFLTKWGVVPPLISSRYQRQSKIELDQLCVWTTVPHARHKTYVKNLPETHCRRQTHRHHPHSGKQTLQEVGRSMDREWTTKPRAWSSSM